MNYEWDDAKSEINRRKHGIAFEAIEDFDWSSAFILPDERFDYGEDRWLAIGMIGSRLYAVTVTIRGDRIRVVSLRRAEPKERRLYHEQSR
jgi:uncharacterized DUF497 family protein